jgi:hypothetical protein
VRPTDTLIACAMGTSAVAISELLIGLSVELMNSGVTNRHENASRCRRAPDSVAMPASLCAPGSATARTLDSLRPARTSLRLVLLRLLNVMGQ